MPLPSSSSPFLKSVVAPRLLPFPPASLTLTLTPVRRGSSGPGGGGGRRPPPFLPPLRRWITRPATTRSMPAVRAPLAPSKSGFRFAGFNSGSDSGSEPNLVKRRGSEPMRLDPAKAGDGEAVNGFCHDQHAPPPPRLLNLPTVLTIGRVVAVPLLISTFYMEAPWGTTATTSIFLLAAITDWLDGYIARKMQMGTAFGAFLDPVADKLMVAATLVLLCTKPFEVPGLGELPWLLPVPAIAIIGREITMSAVREWAASQNKKLLEAVAVNNLGKWKTATQMTALTILLLVRDPSLTGQTTLVASGVALLYVSAGLAVWSLVVYMKKIWKVLIK